MSKTTCILIWGIFFFLAVFLLTVFFSPRDILSDTPIYSDDYAMHFGECLSAKRFLTSNGSCWGYDPYLLAGFPRGALVNADNKGWELWYTALSPLVGSGRAFKSFVIIFLLVYPFFVYLAARNFDLSYEISLIAGAIALLFFNLSLAAAFVSYGMISYVCAGFLSLYVFSLFYRVIDAMTVPRYIMLSMLFALLINIHILSTFHIIIPIATLYLINAKRLPLRQHIVILSIPFVGLVINSYWLIPMVKFVSFKTRNPETWNFTLQIRNLFEPVKVYIFQRKTLFYTIPELNNTFIDVVLLLFGVLGLYGWKLKKLKGLWLPFTGGIIAAFIIAFYGSFTTFFPQFQPERFTVALSLLLIIPASAGFSIFWRVLIENCSRSSSVFIACLLFVLSYRPLVRPFEILFTHKPYRLNCHVPYEFKDLVTFLKNYTTNEGRILIEDSEYSITSPIHEYFGGHLPGLFPEYLKREYLCGPRPMYPIQHGYASFTRGVLFEKKLKMYTAEELKKMFDAYNVKWIVCWHQESKDFFEHLPGYIITLGQVNKFTIYEVQRKPSFFLSGSGEVSADYNRIELQNVVSENDEIVISYHWMEQLRAIPSGTIERVSLAGDPVGFIRIKNPPSKFSIINSY